MSEKKKIGLAEAIKQKLAQKQQQTNNGKLENGLVKKTQPLKSQLTKKPNNQRKRMGV
ncbi:hypothetical protein M670_01432 [Schinkia azotoformans MEV2011]|uniref:Uncharacterized protein n=1 Tax=Schinkia azotoformans MEV2011 TaxID=1348973 RepID=A0A072NNP4_SCHAZ|nr:hypothetical protein [Schinkia azotoformans]KEF39046.1 hypothetical protein M670_01432 [Schinkia azotoformans MEV2011]MEC1698320.1 hypothetical protein [Schinkia azotoformans]MEC1718757.1 hypothetical protein [Schinkia azotoformans]MEC1727679.1 hypothetical protein [Schinkia azotoformans]MEC1743786.1 hypothetical protein [Schinkia azotoformans]